MERNSREVFLSEMIHFHRFSYQESVFWWSCPERAFWEAPERKVFKKRIPNVELLTVSPIGWKKSASTFLLPKKKNIWRRGRTLKSQHRLGRPSETRRPGVRLWRPGGYLRFTLGLPSANPLLTLG